MIMDDEEEEVHYETEEAFVLVQDTARISRDSRARWVRSHFMVFLGLKFAAFFRIKEVLKAPI